MTRNGPSWAARDILKQEKPFTAGEVAKLFNVDPRTVTRWANAGRLESFRTLGGHRRYSVTSVIELFAKLGLKYPGREEQE